MGRLQLKHALQLLELSLDPAAQFNTVQVVISQALLELWDANVQHEELLSVAGAVRHRVRLSDKCL